ncbi:BglG family transcription antiterminator [Streptococcus marmotae]|uniref:BglG family transcription antiterminator n=1 Tax=Streptococcus marmotae TaxID=1825069 RepID=UPI00082E9B93|nr:PTS sugar transporter subunit IIA [Streptococcus marmotae]
MPTQRQVKLLRMMAGERNSKTVAYFANKLGVSVRTVHKEIAELEKEGIVFEKRRGVGIQLLTYNDSVKEVDYYNIQVTRRIDMMRELLFHRRQTSFSDLAERYFVSKSSIKQDLEIITPMLLRGTGGTLLSNHQGTRLLLHTTEDKITAFVNFNHYIIEQSDLMKEIKTSDTIDCLLPYYTRDIIQVCSNVLYTYVREHIQTISEVYVQHFLSFLIAQVYHLIQGEHSIERKSLFNQKKHAFYTESAVKILHKISLRLDFEYTNGDVEYLSQKLLLYRFEPMPSQYVDNSLIAGLINRVSQALNVDFTNDKTLLEQLTWHIPPMLSRLKSQTLVKNPFTEQIKLEFSIVFNVLWLAVSDFSEEIDVEFNEDEIAFLTIYFQLALEKIGVSRKILVVCATGIVTSELLIHRIKNNLPSLDMVEVASSMEAAQLDLDAYDIILTTIPLYQKASHVYFVSPLISEQELLVILNSHVPANVVSQQLTISNLAPYLSEELIFYENQYHSSEHAIQVLSDTLVDKGFVTAAFKQAVLDREILGNTDLPIGVAIPHGKPQEVQRTFVAISKCSKKFKWQDYFVDMIFIVGIRPNDMSKTKLIISGIYELINTEEKLEALRHAKNRTEVLKIIYGRT